MTRGRLERFDFCILIYSLGKLQINPLWFEEILLPCESN